MQSKKNPAFVSVLISLFLIHFSVQLCAAWDPDEWTRVASPGYEVYAPVTMANGVYGITLTEKALQGNMIRLGGIYDAMPGRAGESGIQAVDFTRMELIVMDPEEKDTERADYLKGQLLSDAGAEELDNWSQELNMREGWFRTRYTFEGLDIEHRVFALKHMLHTGVVKMTITAREHRFFSVKNILDIEHPYRIVSAKYIDQLRERKIPLFTLTAGTPSGKYTIATTTTFEFAGGSDAPEVFYIDPERSAPWMGFEHELKKGESLSFYLVGSMCTSKEYSNPTYESARLNIYASLTGIANQIDRHRREWNGFWEKTDVVIGGAPEINKDMRMAMFMVSSFVNENVDNSSACMGLGRDYWGWQILWDADFWIYPAVLLINPGAARSMLEYRFERLDMARHNAAAHGYEGAMFPWESAGRGDEQCPLVYLTGPFQHHITGQVGLAFWRYYCVMQDKEWLREKGYPVLKEVADFWVSRAEKNEQGKYEILNVVGSDEFAINVDNDAITNAVAIRVLNAAHEAAGILGEKPDPEWKEVAGNIIFERFSDGTIREHKTYRGETIKQADVNLDAFPLDVITKKETVHKNLEYYENRITPHGPNMSYAMFAGAAARAGDREEALRLFEKALLPYKKGPFAILSLRTQGVSTYFGTSAGGLLQAFMLGFGGLHFTPDGLVQKDPCLPEGWKSITYKGIGNNQTFTVGR